MIYKIIPEFEKDLKRLTKKYDTLPEDLENARKYAIELFHFHNIDNNSIFAIPKYCTEKYKSYKVKKFACRSLKKKGNQSGIRVIYIYHEESQTVTFIEIYHKNGQANENKRRIEDFFKKL